MCGNYLRLIACVGLWSLSGVGCGDDAPQAQSGDELGDSGVSEPAWVKGRVTDVAGFPLKDVEVVAGSAKGRTDEDGRFSVVVQDKSETRIAVESEKYSGAALSVKANKDATAQVELSVKERSMLMLKNAEQGGRVQADDGFAVELPAAGLKDASGKTLQGDVEVRYATIQRPDDVSAAPGRMQSNNQKSLEGYGFVEVRFYQAGKRLELAKPMRIEVPLRADHALKEGAEVDMFGMGKGDVQWKAASKASVKGNKVELETMRDDWLGAAHESEVDSCVSGSLAIMPTGATTSTKLKNTTLRAARARGLSLVQGESNDDGSFCVPVSPNDDWHVTAYYDDGAQSYGLAVDLNSSEAVGMCGGTGCKQVGEVALPAWN